MKTMGLIILAAVAATAGTKEKPPKVYDLTFHRSELDTHPDVVVSNDYGSSDCYVDTHYVSCSENTGSSYASIEQTGKSYLVVDHEVYRCEEGKKSAHCVYNHLDLRSLELRFSFFIKAKKSYQGRIIRATWGYVDRPANFLCVPTTSTDKKGKTIQGEACYQLADYEVESKYMRPAVI
jgi:hypothetical protein